ncbi:MAG: hypothetical protein WCW02_04280 [Candidatus Buchananbacteria bacterium]
MEFITKLLITFASQILSLFGVFFVLIFSLSYLQQKILTNYHRTVGWSGVLWTGWLGTPVHELGHLIFALIFGHQINQLNLFRPNRRTGELGQLSHSHNDDNLYQKIGNFFIAVGPILSGTTVLCLLLYWLIPNGPQILALLKSTSFDWQILGPRLIELIKLFGQTINFQQPSFWFFLYLSFCVASHLAPSQQDRQGMWRGLALILFILLIINIFTLGLNYDFSPAIASLTKYLALVFSFLLYSLLISTLHWLLTIIILGPIRLFKK